MSDSRGPPAQFGRGPGTPGQHPDQHQQQTNGDSYNGPDSLRNTANKMFNRNGGERSSGYNGQGGGYPNSYGQHGQSLNQSQQNLNHSLNHSLEMSHNYDQSRQQQGTPSNIRPRQNSQEDPAKRNSYNNQSFRNAIQTPGQQQQQHHQQQQHLQQPPPKPGQSQKFPPQVPPKPGSRSASKERPKEQQANDENDHLENELKNILRGNHKDSFDKTNGSGELSIRLM